MNYISIYKNRRPYFASCFAKKIENIDEKDISEANIVYKI